MATKNNTHSSASQTTTSSPAPAPSAQPALATPPLAASPSASPPLSPSPSPSPDPNAALLAYVQQTIATLDAAETGLGADPPLTPKDKLHAAKMRKGGNKAVAQIVNLATQNQLESVALSLAVLTALLGKADALQKLANRLDGFVKHVGDVIFSAQSSAWEMAMQYYALLQRRAAVDAELASALAPVTAFFAYRHPSTKAPVGSPTKRQRQAVNKAARTLKTVAGGKLANGLEAPAAPAPAPSPSPSPAPAPSPTPSPAGNGAPPNGASPTPATNGGAAPATHS